MTDTAKPAKPIQPAEQSAKVRAKARPESLLTPTFAAGRIGVTGNLDHEGQLPADSLLLRRCVCGAHTIAGGECHTCRQKQAADFLQRTAVTRVPEAAQR